MTTKQQQALWVFHLARKRVIQLRQHVDQGWPTGDRNFEALLRRAEEKMSEARMSLLKTGIDSYWPHQASLDEFEAQHDREFERRLSCIHYVLKCGQMPSGYDFKPNEDCCGHGGRESSHDICTSCPHYREITPEERQTTGWGGP